MLRALTSRLLPRPVKAMLKRALGMPARQLHSDWAIVRCAGPVSTPHVVIDAGAHHGWFFGCWLHWCPAAEVHAFEPAAEAMQDLRRTFGTTPNVHLVPAGLGDEDGELELRVLDEARVANSFIDPDPQSWASIDYHTGRIERRRVPVTTLDTYAARNGIGAVHLIKIDVQGFELRLLRGAEAVLARTNWVLVECGLRRLYLDAPNAGDVIAFMERAGFHVYDLRAWHRGNGVLIEADLLFRRNELAPAIEPDADRQYLALRP